MDCEHCPGDGARVGGPTATRRAMLLGTGAAGVAALLSACGTGSSPANQANTDTAHEASPDLGPTSAIPVGGGKIFDAQDVVVTQPTDGSFKAFTATCTHQGCTVGTVANGLITCPCHGSQYSIVDGSVVRGPAPSPLAELAITVANGEITLS